MKLVTIKEAIEIADKFYGFDPSKHGRNYVKKSLIYNYMYKGKLKNYGFNRKIAMLSIEEFSREILHK